MQASRLETGLFNVLVALSALALALPMIGLLLPIVSLSLPSDGLTLDSFSLGSRQLLLLGHSVAFSAMVALATVTLGAGLAIALQRSPLGRATLTLILPPLIVVPPAIHGINWTTTMLGAGEWLRRHELADTLSSGWFPAGLAEVLSFLPIAIALSWAGFAMLDVRLLEAGRIYRSESAVLWGIAARLAMPVLLSGAGVVFLLSLSEYAVPSLFSVHVFALEIFSTYSTGVHPAVAVLTAVPLVIVIVAVLMSMLRAGRRAQSMDQPPRNSTRSVDYGTAAGNLGAGVLAAYLAFPLAAMAATARSPQALTLAASSARSELTVTMAISLCAAALCLILGFGVGRTLDRKGPASTILWILTCLAVGLPGPLIGIGILSIAGFGTWPDDLLPVWAATARFLPIAAFVSFAMHRRIDRGLIEAGRVFADGRLDVLRRVTLPLMVPGLLVALVTCFAFSLGELGATLLVAAPGHATVMMRLYNLLHYGASQEAAALCLLVTLPPLIAGLLLAVLLRLRAANERQPDHA